MPSSLFTVLFASLIVLLTACQTVDHTASDNTSDQGIGGTGVRIANSDDRGIGGTGAPAISMDDRGIGGTGIIADNGIGGTGISNNERSERWLNALHDDERILVAGTIHDFGSIWVNGLHIRFSTDTRVTLNNQAVPLSSIRLGQLGIVTARKSGQTLIADRIELTQEVVGRVTSVNPAQRRFTVLGQTVVLNEGLPLPDKGQRVGVSGLRNPQAYIIASQIDLTPSSENDLVRGYATLQNGAINLSGFTADAPAQITDTLKTGDTSRQFVTLHLAEFRGSADQKKQRIARIERIKPLTDRAGIRYISVERSSFSQIQSGRYLPESAAKQVLRDKPSSDSAGISGKPYIVESNMTQEGGLSLHQKRSSIQVNYTATPPTGSGHTRDSGHQQNPKGSPSLTTEQDPAKNQGPATQQNAPEGHRGEPSHSPQYDKPQHSDPQHNTPVRNSPSHNTRPAGADRPRPARPATPSRPERLSRPERPARVSRPERPQRPERPDNTTRPERPERPTGRPER